MSDALLALKDVSRSYKTGSKTLTVLDSIRLEVKAGEVVALVAPSGAGKSTLLHIAGLLDTATSGSVMIDGQEMSVASDRERTAFRRDRIGFVYQFHHLLPDFSAAENVAMPCRSAGMPPGAAMERAAELLEKVGLAARMSHRPAELSGGEQQRVAVARALANGPALLLADEPTGNLDPETAEQVFEVLIGLARDTGLAALVATHNHELAARMDRIVRLAAGRVT